MHTEYTEEEYKERNKLIEKYNAACSKIKDYEINRGIIPDDDEENERIAQENAEIYQQQWEDDLYEEASKWREKIFSFDHKVGDRERLREWKNEKATYEKGQIVNERISAEDLDDDIFDREKEAKRIAKILCSEHLRSPHNVAVLGNWGSGKTTFFEYIKRAIKAEDIRKKCKIIDYNAAEYSFWNAVF